MSNHFAGLGLGTPLGDQRLDLRDPRRSDRGDLAIGD